MDGLIVLKHKTGNVFLLETKPTKPNVSKVKRVLKDLNPHIVAVEICQTKLEDVSELRKFDHQISLNLIPTRLMTKAKQERALVQMLRDAIAHGDICRKRKSLRAQMVGLNVAPATLQNLHTDKVFQNRDLNKEMRTIFETAAIWHLDVNTFKYLTSLQSPYKIMLAGRPYEDTVCDIIDAISEEEKKIIEVYMKNFRKLFVSNYSTRTIMTHIMQRNHKLKSIVVDKRDQYLVNSFLQAMNSGVKQSEPMKILALVRKSRVKGIIKNWNKKVSNK